MIKNRSEQFKNLLEILIIATLVIVAFFWATKSYAYILYQQPISDTETPNTITLGHDAISGNIATFGQYLGTNLSGNLTTTTVWLRADPGLGNMTVGVTIECYDDSNYTTYNANCSVAPKTNASTSPILYSGEALQSFTTTSTLNPSKYYRLGIGCENGCSGGTNPNLRTLGTTQNLYANGDFASSTITSSTLGIKDLDFQLFGSAGNSTFDIDFPIASTTYNPNDLGTFLVHTSNLSPNTTYYVKFYTGTHNSGQTQLASDCTITQNTTSSQSNICLNNFNYTNALNILNSTSTQFDLQAFLYSDAAHQILLNNSTVITFTAALTSNSQPILGTSSDSIWKNFVSSTSATYLISSSTIQLDCEPSWSVNGVVCAMTNAWNILFAKITGGVAITSWKDGLKAAFPFNVYFTITGLAQNGVTNAYNTDNTIYAIKLPMITNSSPYLSTSTTVTLLDQNTLTNTIGTNAKNTWFTPQKYLMWGATAITMITTLF